MEPDKLPKIAEGRIAGNDSNFQWSFSKRPHSKMLGFNLALWVSIERGNFGKVCEKKSESKNNTNRKKEESLETAKKRPGAAARLLGSIPNSSCNPCAVFAYLSA
jgi:hypothetical protein